MLRKRHKPEEIVAKLRQVDVLTSQSKSAPDATSAIRRLRRLWYRRQKYGGLKLKHNIATDRNRSEAVRILPQDNEDHISTVLALLWRRSSFIAGFCLVVVTIAVLVTSLVQNRYTADAIIQVRLAADNQQAQSGIALNAVTLNAVTLNAASMIETEARLISSRTVAERVASRLKLANDTLFTLGKSLTGRAHDLFASVWPSFDKLHPRSAESLIADELMRNLEVTNDVRSYLIRISYTSTSPEQSARIANAFAGEYLRMRAVSRARQELADLIMTYGPKHPRILKTQAKLDKAIRYNISEDAQLLMRAEAIDVPSSPNWPLIIGLSFMGSLAVGSVIVLIQKRAAFRP